MGSAPRYHFGVYARIRDAQRILLVRKTRGPYAGLLDLPGGSPEPGETWPQTLERELHEELGIHLTPTGDFQPFAIHVRETADGSPINFHHHGAILDLQLPTGPVRSVLSSDTAGHEWFSLRSGRRSRLSPVVRAVLQG